MVFFIKIYLDLKAVLQLAWGTERLVEKLKAF